MLVTHEIHVNMNILMNGKEYNDITTNSCYAATITLGATNSTIKQYITKLWTSGAIRVLKHL